MITYFVFIFRFFCRTLCSADEASSSAFIGYSSASSQIHKQIQAFDVAAGFVAFCCKCRLVVAVVVVVVVAVATAAPFCKSLLTCCILRVVDVWHGPHNLTGLKSLASGNGAQNSEQSAQNIWPHDLKVDDKIVRKVRKCH